MQTALHIPADINQPVQLVEYELGESLGTLQHLVGGLVDVQAHSEGDVWCHDESRIINLPVNPRVSYWMLRDSKIAKEGNASEWNVFYGEVVLTGPVDDKGDTTSVEPGMFEYFKALKVNPTAMKDWDVRSTDIRVTSWDL